MTRPTVIALACATLLTLGPRAAGAQDSPAMEVSTKEEENPKCSEEEKTLDCEKPRRTGYFEIGVGYSPDEQVIVRSKIAQDRLFGTKQGLSLSASLTGRRQELSLQHSNPDLFGSGLDYKSELFDRRLAYPGFVRHGRGASFTLARQLNPTTRASLGYSLEDVTLEEPIVAMSDFSWPGAMGHGLVDPYRDGLVGGLRAGLSYDDRVRSRANGQWTRASLSVSRNHASLGSDFDFTRASATATHQRPLLGPFTLKLHGSAHAIWTHDPLGIPLTERLHFEGHRDVRGHSLGSRGVGLGGDLKTQGRAELGFPLFERNGHGLRGAVFYDAGLLRLQDSYGKSALRLQHSAGAGLIWNSPIGDMRLDFALPLSGEDSGEGPIVLFGLGGEF